MRSAAPLEMDIWSRYKEVQDRGTSARLEILHVPTPVMNFMDQLIRLLGPCREHWQNFNQYFFLFMELAKLSPESRRMLMEANIAKLFSDWFSGIGYRTKVVTDLLFPDLRDFFNTLQIIWCGCFQGPDDCGVTPYGFDPQFLIKADPQFKRDLFSDFIRLAIEHPYNVQAVARIVCHACYNDVLMSLRFLNIFYNFLELDPAAMVSTNRVTCAYLDIADGLQDARMLAMMTKKSFEGSTGILGALQLAQIAQKNNQLDHSDSKTLRYLELLEHCCHSDFGFAIALRSRDMIDWLDGYCINRICEEMRKVPELFESVCFNNDFSKLDTPEGREYAGMDLIKCFRIIHGIITRMDHLTPKQFEGYNTLFARRYYSLVENAYLASMSGNQFFMQPDWFIDSVVPCGRFAPPVSPFRKFERHAVVVHPESNRAASESISNANTPVTPPTPAQIDSLVAQARDVLGEMLDEAKFRKLLKDHNYNFEATMDAMFN